MALAMVQAAAVDVAGGGAADAVDAVDAADAADVVDGGAADVDEVGVVDVVAAWVSRADETSVHTHRIRAAVPVAARFVGNASRYCQTWP